MKETLNKWIDAAVQNESVREFFSSEFCRGIIFGIIAGILFILVLRFIIWMCCRKKRCSAISVDNPAGNVTVTSSAVCDVIKYAAKDIRSMKIKKIRIYKVREGFNIAVNAVMDTSKGGTTPKLIEEISDIIRKQMLDVFGIDNVNMVKLQIDSCIGSDMDDGDDYIEPADEEKEPEKEQIFSVRPSQIFPGAGENIEK